MSKQISERLKLLIDREEYEEIFGLGESMEREEFLMHIYSLMTTIERCKRIFKHLESYDLHLGFLLHGDETLVKEAIATFKNRHFEYYISAEHIRQAIGLFFNENRYDRVFDFLEAVKARYTEEDKRCKQREKTMLEDFMDSLLPRLLCDNDGMAFKRFLTLWRAKLDQTSPSLFEIICQQLVLNLRMRLWEPTAQKLLSDLVGQPSLLTPTAFINGFLTLGLSFTYSRGIYFIMYGWREVIQEALGKQIQAGDKELWEEMMCVFPDEFPEEYPPSEEVLTTMLKKFKTKQELEEAWAEENAPELLKQCEESDVVLPSIAPLDTAPRSVITRITTTQSSPQGHLVSQTKEQISELFETLMDEGRYLELAKLSESMSTEDLLEYLYPLIDTFERCKKFFWYLQSPVLLSNFLVYNDIALVRRVIVEFSDDTFKYFISEHRIRDAITLSLDENIYDRVLELFEATQTKHAEEDKRGEQPRKVPKIQRFIHGLFVYPNATKNSKSLKHFLTTRGDELQEKYPNVFEILCQELVSRLRIRLAYPGSKELLIDLVGQPSLLTTTAFARGFLNYYDYECFYVDNFSNKDDDYDDNYPVKADNTFARNFVTHCWREAFVEGLKEEYSCGGERLWSEMTAKFPGELSKEYPPSEETLAVALAKFKTKQELEEQWVRENSANFVLQTNLKS